MSEDRMQIHNILSRDKDEERPFIRGSSTRQLPIPPNVERTFNTKAVAISPTSEERRVVPIVPSEAKLPSPKPIDDTTSTNKYISRAASSSVSEPHEIPLRDITRAQASTSDVKSSVRTISDKEQLDAQVPLVSTKKIAWILVLKTAPYTLSGIAFMLLGIGLIQAVVLPLIYSCPPDAACSSWSRDPNTSNILNTLQTVMQYWFKLGLILSGLGLMRLSAYQSWLQLMKNGNTMENLDLHLGAIKGSFLDAARLVLRRGNFSISILLIAAFGIDTSIPLIVGQSIIRTNGTRFITFRFNSTSVLPNSNWRVTNADDQLRAISKVTSWALNNDTFHDGALHGSLVVPDGRTNFSVDPFPQGLAMDGSFSCSPISLQNITLQPPGPSGKQNITILYNQLQYVALSDIQLGVTEAGGIDTATVRYLWFSNTTGLLPNATAVETSNATYYTTVCQHDLSMSAYPPNQNQNQNDKGSEIEPNDAKVAGCSSSDMHICVADSVSNAIYSWWGGYGQTFWRVNCRGGVLGPLKLINNNPCSLTPSLWKETAASMLDAMMQTAPTEGSNFQTLLTRVQDVDKRQWWLQVLIPSFTLILYGMMLGYTCYLSEGNIVLKDLNVVEIIDAAQSEHMQHLIEGNGLGRALVRYGSNVGFFSKENGH